MQHARIRREGIYLYTKSFAVTCMPRLRLRLRSRLRSRLRLRIISDDSGVDSDSGKLGTTPESTPTPPKPESTPTPTHPESTPESCPPLCVTMFMLSKCNSWSGSPATRQLFGLALIY